MMSNPEPTVPTQTPPAVGQNQTEGEPPAKKLKMELGTTHSGETSTVATATPVTFVPVSMATLINTSVAVPTQVASTVAMAMSQVTTQNTPRLTQVTAVPATAPPGTVPTIITTVQPQVPVNVTSSVATATNSSITPLANSFPGRINLTISNGAINMKPSGGPPPITKTEGQNMVLQQGSPGIVRAPTCTVSQVNQPQSGSNVTIRAPMMQSTVAPINVRLPGGPGSFNIQLTGQPGMQGTQGLLNTSIINPMLGNTQAVAFQRAPVPMPMGATPSSLTMPLQQQQLTNITMQQASAGLPKGQVLTSTGIQGQVTPASVGGILGQAAVSAGIPTVAVGVTPTRADAGMGMADSKAGTSMGLALGLAVAKKTTASETSSSGNEQSIGGTDHASPAAKIEKDNTGLIASEEGNVKEEGENKMKCETPQKDEENGLEFDPMEALKWDNGVGTLPGSDLKFRMNEFGAMELIMDDQDTNDSGTTELNTPDVGTDQGSSETSVSPETIIISEDQQKGDEFVRCIQCGTYGMAADFFKSGPEERFCSQACQRTYRTTMSAVHKPTTSKKMAKDLAVIKYKKKRLMVDDMNPRPLAVAMGRGRPRVRTMEPADAEDVEVAKTMATAKKMKGFSWNTYLEQERATAPPMKLFKGQQAFPTNKNSFKVGMKLEGIDPRHPSLYCVLTVAEVRGYRIRLHFDGYSECHDFWVNASSVDIFPIGWCEKNNKKLQVPKGCGFTPETFSWQSYLKLSKAQAAPRHLFQSQQAASVTPHGFRVGMKLEAIDKKNTILICVATVADIIGDRILIHFDGWEDSYDYWADPTSPFIKPVGYCQDTEKVLSPPNDCEDIKNFTWERYLKQTKSQPVPARAFKPRAPHQFEIHHKLEVVDKRNPILIRVATIVNIEEYRLKIHFDGWSDVFDDWLDDDCPDFHPPGWCAKTGHPLQPPISPQDLVVSPSQGGCPTPGCKGIGHIKGAKYTGHHSAFGCPYSAVNMSKGNTIGDRLASKSDEISPPPKLSFETKSSPLTEKKIHGASKYKDMINGDQTYKPRLGPGRPSRKKHKFLARMKEQKEEDDDEDQENFLHNGIHQSVFMSAMVPNPVKDFPLCWEQHSKLLPGVGKIKGAAVAKWSIEEVAMFVKSLPGCDEQGKIFQDEQIDGEAFLLLNQTDIVKIMNIKLGPALKIYNSILMFKNTAES